MLTKPKHQGFERNMTFDFIVIGAGISGASVAEALADHGKVALLEAETAPGYHTTGRSAALYTPNYGGPVVRAINSLSRDFFHNPPDGLCETPLLSRRGALGLAGPGHEAALDDVLALSTTADPVVPVTRAEALELAPYMRPDRIAAAVLEPGVCDIDVAALHQGYLKRFRRQGGELRTAFRVVNLTRSEGVWRVNSAQETLTASVVVNAAGAWADRMGQMAGLRPIGLVPKRRTAIMVDLPDGLDASRNPVIDFAGVANYIKPEKGRLMVSPGDETPMEPQDVQPDEFDIAVLVDWLENETTLKVRRIGHSWAGLRCFVADQAPVVGFDEDTDGFFWLAGQGGFGIMMAPALAALGKSLIVDGRFDDRTKAAGVSADDLDPARLRA